MAGALALTQLTFKVSLRPAKEAMTPPSNARPLALPKAVFLRADGVWEKRTAAYELAEVRQVVSRLGASVFGVQAIRGVALMQLKQSQAVAAILALRPEHFYKSMTSEHDPTHTLWQDVYHGPTDNGLAYIKFMIWYPPAHFSKAATPNPKLVVSFKKL